MNKLQDDLNEQLADLGFVPSSSDFHTNSWVMASAQDLPMQKRGWLWQQQPGEYRVQVGHDSYDLHPIFQDPITAAVWVNLALSSR